MWCSLLVLSDTHNKLDEILSDIFGTPTADAPPPFDLLVHCGDMVCAGTLDEIEQFHKEASHWFPILAKEIILVSSSSLLTQSSSPDDTRLAAIMIARWTPQRHCMTHVQWRSYKA